MEKKTFAGYCPACNLMLCIEDKTELGDYECPGCKSTTDKLLPEMKHRELPV